MNPSRALVLGSLLCGAPVMGSAQILYTSLSTPVVARSSFPDAIGGTQEVNFELGVDEAANATIGPVFDTPSTPDAFSLFTYAGATGTTEDGGVFADVGGTGPAGREFAVLTAGESVEAAISASHFVEVSNNLNGNDVYVALETGDGHYGWAQVDVGSSTVTLLSFAVNLTAGEDILVGQTASAVPEPRIWTLVAGAAALGLVGMGSIGRRLSAAGSGGAFRLIWPAARV